MSDEQRLALTVGGAAYTATDVEQLLAELAEAKRERDQAHHDVRISAAICRDVNPIIEAAKAWRVTVARDGEYATEDADALMAAVDALPIRPSSSETAAEPGEPTPILAVASRGLADNLHALLIRLARRVVLHDSVKQLTGLATIGDLVVEMSSCRPIPDPGSIGFLRAIETDDRDPFYLIEPLNAVPGAEWERWGNAMFGVLTPKYWHDLGFAVEAGSK